MKKHAYTLLELMVVISIAGIILGLGIISVQRLRLNAQISAFLDAKKTLETALRNSFIHNGFIESYEASNTGANELPASLKPYLPASFELSHLSYMNGRGAWSWTWNPQGNEFSITLITHGASLDWERFKSYFKSQSNKPDSGLAKVTFLPDNKSPESIVSSCQIGI